jgi:hypothetical protein
MLDGATVILHSDERESEAQQIMMLKEMASDHLKMPKESFETKSPMPYPTCPLKERKNKHRNKK